MGELGTADSTVNYFYSDSAWGDLVTRYNHKDITYDGIGNPLTDGDHLLAVQICVSTPK